MNIQFNRTRLFKAENGLAQDAQLEKSSSSSHWGRGKSKGSMKELDATSGRQLTVFPKKKKNVAPRKNVIAIINWSDIFNRKDTYIINKKVFYFKYIINISKNYAT